MIPDPPCSPKAKAPFASTSKLGSPVSRPVKRIQSAELFREGSELIILHAGREYRLRVTNNGKLLLTA